MARAEGGACPERSEGFIPNTREGLVLNGCEGNPACPLEAGKRQAGPGQRVDSPWKARK